MADAFPLRVLHVTAPARVGGLESVVRMLGAGHRHRGHDIHVVAVLDHDDPSHPFLGALDAAGVTTHIVCAPGRAYGRERAEVRALCRRLEPDVVHTHGYRTDVVDAPVARRIGIPVITTVHGFTGGGVRGRIYEWAQLMSYRRFDAVVCVSRAQLPVIRASGVTPGRTHVIRNAFVQSSQPIDAGAARRELGVSTRAFHIGWVGRLSMEKGADLFIEATLRLNDLPVHVSVIGDGPERARIARRIEAAGFDGRCRIVGNITNAARLFGGFDVFVMSSRTEGTPIVLLEAMAAGVPVVAPRVGGIPDVVSEAEALLVPPGDARALADAIRSIYVDRDDAAARARAARKRLVQEFSVEPWLDAYEALYRAVATQRTARSHTP